MPSVGVCARSLLPALGSVEDSLHTSRVSIGIFARAYALLVSSIPAGQTITPFKQLNKIYVGNLPVNTREDDLEGCFGEMGRILGVELKYVVCGFSETGGKLMAII